MGGGWRRHRVRADHAALMQRSCYDSIFIQLGDEILQLGVDRMRLCGYFVVVLIGVLVSIPVTAQRSKARKSRAAAPGQAEIERMTARFAPTQLQVDISKLSSGDRQALAKIIEAARILNDIFMKQYWSGDTALYARLQRIVQRWARRGCIISGSTKAPGRRWTNSRHLCLVFRRGDRKGRISIRWI